MRFLRIAALGAAVIYFFHPQNGARRRNAARDRLLALFHRREAPKSYDDQTLKAKVESEVFRPADAPKGDVDVNVEHGVVYLRGQVGPEVIEDLEERVRSVQGVKDVENLLHVPGTEAPTR